MSPCPPWGTCSAALATGVWRWDNAHGQVTIDAEAARLLGLPAARATVTEVAMRSRFHPADWNEVVSVVQLAIAEDTLAEVRLRIMDEHGRVIRTVRSRSKPTVDPETREFVLFGTLQEVTETSGATAARTRSPATGAARARRSCWTRAGAAPRRGPRRRYCGRGGPVDAGVQHRTGWPSSAWTGTGSPSSVTTGRSRETRAPSPICPWPPTTRPRRSSAQGRAVYLSLPEGLQGALSGLLAARRTLGRESWAFLPLTVAGRTMGA